MHRLFVACIPPEEVRRSLLAIMGGMEGARWQSDAQLHITLRYIGEVDGRTADTVADSLSRVAARACDVAVHGVGSFDRRGKVHSVWAGVRPVAPLEALHQKLDRALVMTGLPPEARAYRPHITLARLSRPQADVDAFLRTWSALTSPPFRLDHMVLFESLPTAEGSHYRPVERYRLALP